MTREGLAGAWDALREGRCEEALTRFEADAGRDPDDASALEGLGLARRWLDDIDGGFEAAERAYRLYRENGDATSAARMATRLARDSVVARGDATIAGGWLARAGTLLEGLGDVPERGWLALREGQVALAGLDAQAARGKGEEAARVGAACGDVDLEISGRSLTGLATVAAGDVAAGMRMLDEATAAAVAGELEWIDVAGAVCCDLIMACEQVDDLSRAAQWCDAATAISDRGGLLPLAGICRSQYATLLMRRGEWAEAERELQSATETLSISAKGMRHEGLLRLAELRRRQGRFDEARELCREVEWHPQAVLCLARTAHSRGETDEAADLAERYLRRYAGGMVKRAPGLELCVELRVAAGDLEGARAASEELDRIAGGAGTPLLAATAGLTQARVLHASGSADAARQALEDAIDGFGSCGAPYEEAGARMELARMLSEAGRDKAGRDQAARAAAALAQLGAAEEGEPSPLTARETEVLQLVASGLSDDAVADRLVLSPHTVHRHVANIRTKLRQPSRAAAAAEAARTGLI